METLTKKYGLFTAMAMVIGIVIGSGVFFKAEKILIATGGNLPIGILAWALGGCIMIISAYTFSIMATRFEKVNGLVDYAEAYVNEKYAYFIGWFMTTMYTPSLTAVLAWVSARYLGTIFGMDITGGSVMVLAGFMLILAYGMSALAPVLAGKFQVSTTVIKLIPLLLMAVVGTIVGLSNGMTVENFTTVMDSSISKSEGLLTAVCATCFAYEGWILATSINQELRNAKKNLPIALLLGSIIVVTVYILYYVGLAGAVPNKTLVEAGEGAVKTAYSSVFGQVGGVLLMVFIVISCMGTLNGLMMANTRGMYALAMRNRGPKPNVYKVVDPITNMPTNSSIFGLLLAGVWLVYFYGANLTKSWFGPFTYDCSELCIVMLYALYLPIYIQMMRKGKSQGMNAFQYIVVPILAMLAALFMIYSCIVSHKWANLYYFITTVVVMGIGALVMKKKD